MLLTVLCKCSKYVHSSQYEAWLSPNLVSAATLVSNLVLADPSNSTETVVTDGFGGERRKKQLTFRNKIFLKTYHQNCRECYGVADALVNTIRLQNDFDKLN